MKLSSADSLAKALVGLTLRAALSVSFVAPASAGDAIFLDGFESCDGSAWSSSGGLPDCSNNLVCPTPTSGKACVAGRLLDVETSARLCSSPVVSTACTSGLQGGPCELQVQVADGLGFVTDPSGTTQIPADEILIDGCGRFRISNFTAPGTGVGAISARDDGETFVQHVLSADIRPVASGAKIEGIHLYAVRASTDLAWTTTAGSPFGSDAFSDQGVVVPIFLYHGEPVAGVQILVNGSGDPDDDYYFSDTDPSLRAVVDANLSSTGIDGSGILVTTTLGEMSGSGSEPIACEWPASLAGSASGLVVVKELMAQVIGVPGTPCP